MKTYLVTYYKTGSANITEEYDFLASAMRAAIPAIERIEQNDYYYFTGVDIESFDEEVSELVLMVR